MYTIKNKPKVLVGVRISYISTIQIIPSISREKYEKWILWINYKRRCIFSIFWDNDQSVNSLIIYMWTVFRFNRKYGVKLHLPIQARRQVSLSLTHCGLVMPYGDIDLGQHWLRWWLVAWRHQAITWTNVDFTSIGPFSTHLRRISQEMLKISIHKMSLKTLLRKPFPHLSGANELNDSLKKCDHAECYELWLHLWHWCHWRHQKV